MNLNSIGIISIPNREKCSPILSKLLQWISQHSIKIYLDTNTASFFPEGSKPQVSIQPIEGLPKYVDLILVLGGDGTMLRVARQLGEANIQMLGVNLGGLGFLTDINVNNLIPVLDKVLKGKYSVDERMMLCATVEQKGHRDTKTTFALNDIVITSGQQSRLINLAAYVDEKWINTFMSDGLIVSTPTGSTAYSLSAGGPIIHPRLHAILITPICPHILTNRPIVIPNNEKIKVVVQQKGRGNDEDCLVSVDGQVLAFLKPEDYIIVYKASHTIKLIQPDGNDYYQILRTKLNWGKRG